MQIKQRDTRQDIAKGIAITLVVLLHIVEAPNIVRIIMGLLFGYAMPFFIFMCGFNYKNKGLTPFENIKKRLKQIIIPFFLYTLIIAIIMSIHFVLNNEATISQCFISYIGFLLSRWGTPYIGWDLPKILFQRVFGPLWFIQFLIPSTVIFYLFVDKALESTKKFLIIILSLATISCLLIELGLVLPWGLQLSPVLASVMIMAAYLHQDNRLLKEPSQKKWIYINSLVCLSIIAAIELYSNTAGYVAAGEMGEDIGGIEAYVTLIIALCGTYFLMNFAKLVEKIPYVSNAYIWLGQHSLSILFMHLPLAHLVIDFFGYQQMITEFPVAVEHFSINQIITFVVTMTILYILITVIEKITKSKKTI